LVASGSSLIDVFVVVVFVVVALIGRREVLRRLQYKPVRGSAGRVPRRNNRVDSNTSRGSAGAGVQLWCLHELNFHYWWVHLYTTCNLILHVHQRNLMHFLT
jgi:hypothetical protein